MPGESFLPVLDALHDCPSIRTTVCRHEAGAAMMAEADGRISGQPGICFVTRAPGATNAAAGVHVAFQSSSPMILFIGQVATKVAEREAFQEVDYRHMFRPLAKWVAEIQSVQRIPEFVSRAYHAAVSGRPGPVVLAIPEDVLSACADVIDARPARPVAAKAGPEEIAAFVQALNSSQQPMLVIGGGGWDRATALNLARFVGTNQLPVCAAFRCQDYLDNTHPSYVGHAGIGIDGALAQRIRQCDLLVVIGDRLAEITTSGYSLVDIPSPQMKFVHIYPQPDELGRSYRPDLGIPAASAPFASAIADLRLDHADRWRPWTAAARADYEASIAPQETPGNLKLEQAICYLRDRLPRDAVVTNGAGNYTTWLHRYYLYRDYRTQLAPVSGSMGYGLPAAIAAKLAHPERTVVCFAGDGCFMMTAQELATAVSANLAIVIVVVNNGMYGTIRMHQEHQYPGRVHATALVNPDFAAFADSFGARGIRAKTTDAFKKAVEDALVHDGPVLIEAIVDPNALTAGATLRQVRERGEHR